MMMRIITLASAFAIVSSIGLAQDAVVGAEVEEPKPTITPTARVTCELSEPKKFSMYIKGSSQELLSLSVNDCRYAENIAGVVSVNAELLIDLNETTDVQLCQNIRVAHLLELSSQNPDFEWASRRVLVDELSIENLSENVRDISLLSLHDKLSGTPVLLTSVLNKTPFEPSFDDLFWGDIVVFEEPDGATFSRLLKSKLPEEGKTAGTPDYVLKLSLKSFEPRGVCSYQSEVTKDGKKSTVTKFVPLTLEPAEEKK
tara:strand:- start:3924 stop:4694 length:771 start_codon:yes stop_codon:yes gene_type:complete